MSYFEDQFDAWMDNDCKGSIEDYDPFDSDSWPTQHAITAAPARLKGPARTPPTRTKTQKRRAQKKRAMERKRLQAAQAIAPNGKESAA
jgi:hypothetical protein